MIRCLLLSSTGARSLEKTVDSAQILLLESGEAEKLALGAEHHRITVRPDRLRPTRPSAVYDALPPEYARRPNGISSGALASTTFLDETELLVRQRQRPKTEVTGGVGHRAQHKLDRLNHLVDHDL